MGVLSLLYFAGYLSCYAPSRLKVIYAWVLQHFRSTFNMFYSDLYRRRGHVCKWNGGVCVHVCMCHFSFMPPNPHFCFNYSNCLERIKKKRLLIHPPITPFWVLCPLQDGIICHVIPAELLNQRRFYLALWRCGLSCFCLVWVGGSPIRCPLIPATQDIDKNDII